MDTQATRLRSSRPNVHGSASTFSAALPFLALLLVGLAFPLFGGGYWGVIATRACVYWVLVSGLNLVVGFGGQIAIGWVALLTLGAYTTSVLVAGNVTPELPPYLALAIAAVVGAIFGLIIGLPALRLRTFYFAITTLGFATIVTQVALAWQSVTGGGIGIVGPEFPAPFNTAWGYYYLCVAFAAFCTWMSANIAHSRFGRALIAVRDAEVAAEATGISKPRMLIAIFLFAGALAAIAGGLFASLQTYITPDAFTFDLSILFFIAILIGGRGSILGPMLGTIILTILPEVAAPLAAWSTFLYAVLLLVIVLAMPGGGSRHPASRHSVDSGLHVMKMGGEFRHYWWFSGSLSNDVYGTFNFNGSIAGNGFAELLLGVPFTATWGTGGDPQGLLNSDDWAFPDRLTTPGCANLVNPGNPNHYIKTECFSVPSAPNPAYWTANCDPAPPSLGGPVDPASLQCFNLRGNAARNLLTGPGTTNLDLSIFKNMPIKRISESFNIQFRAEFFNAPNHPQFDLPNAVIGNASAGIISKTVGSPRDIQLSLRLAF
jgi:ABC-type branched-subunit amino acid transport system permease subunit